MTEYIKQEMIQFRVLWIGLSIETMSFCERGFRSFYSPKLPIFSTFCKERDILVGDAPLVVLIGDCVSHSISQHLKSLMVYLIFKISTKALV